MVGSIYVFDAYGTLFDVHSAAARQAEAIGPDWGRLSEIWRVKQLEYTWVLLGAGQHDSFSAVTERALDFAIAMLELDLAAGTRTALLQAYRRLDAYPEAAGVLSALQNAGAKTMILSNGDPDMLDEAVAAAGLAAHLDDVISASRAGCFKPDRKVYQLVLETTGAAPGDVQFQSSNRWDIAGAHTVGFKTNWINRNGAPDEYPGQPYDRTLVSLSSLLAAV